MAGVFAHNDMAFVMAKENKIVNSQPEIPFMKHFFHCVVHSFTASFTMIASCEKRKTKSFR
jgi:hypothetical protein